MSRAQVIHDATFFVEKDIAECSGNALQSYHPAQSERSGAPLSAADELDLDTDVHHLHESAVAVRILSVGITIGLRVC